MRLADLREVLETAAALGTPATDVYLNPRTFWKFTASSPAFVALMAEYGVRIHESAEVSEKEIRLWGDADGVEEEGEASAGAGQPAQEDPRADEQDGEAVRGGARA